MYLLVDHQIFTQFKTKISRRKTSSLFYKLGLGVELWLPQKQIQPCLHISCFFNLNFNFVEVFFFFYLKVFWSYIVGMLTNLESLPLDRIHSMLRMFAMQGPSSSQCSVDDLRRFLDRKVKDQELQFVNGFYRLPKSGR